MDCMGLSLVLPRPVTAFGQAGPLVLIRQDCQNLRLHGQENGHHLALVPSNMAAAKKGRHRGAAFAKMAPVCNCC